VALYQVHTQFYTFGGTLLSEYGSYRSTLTARKRGSRPVVDGFESCEEQYARLPHLAFDALLLDRVGMFAVQQGTAKVVLALAVLHFAPNLMTVRCCMC